MSQPLVVKDCNLSIIATGEVAESLSELKDILYRIPPTSLYYHFWCGRLRISFVHPEYHNDFAQWAYFGLRDKTLAERLTMIDPTEYNNYEDLRKKVIDVVEERLEELEYRLWTEKEDRFHFLRSIIIVYDTGVTILQPLDLKTIIPKMSPTSIFYHFIDARRRTADGSDDFSLWLASFGDQFKDLIQNIKLIDPYFLSLSEIKQRLVQLFSEKLI